MADLPLPGPPGSPPPAAAPASMGRALLSAALGAALGVGAWALLATFTDLWTGFCALLVGAALRLLPLGQMEGQRVLWRLHPVIWRVAREAAVRDPADLSAFAPGLDIAAMRHASLETRLFRS